MKNAAAESRNPVASRPRWPLEPLTITLTAKTGKALDRDQFQRLTDEVAEAKRQLEELPSEKAPRLLSNDATPEVVGSPLAKNGGRLGIAAPEGTDPVIEDAKHLLRWLQNSPRDSFTHQECWQANKKRFVTVAPLDAALGNLRDRFLRELPGDAPRTGRRPKPAFLVHPDLATPKNAP